MMMRLCLTLASVLVIVQQVPATKLTAIGGGYDEVDAKWTEDSYSRKEAKGKVDESKAHYEGHVGNRGGKGLSGSARGTYRLKQKASEDAAWKVAQGDAHSTLGEDNDFDESPAVVSGDSELGPTVSWRVGDGLEEFDEELEDVVDDLSESKAHDEGRVAKSGREGLSGAALGRHMLYNEDSVNGPWKLDEEGNKIRVGEDESPPVKQKPRRKFPKWMAIED